MEGGWGRDVLFGRGGIDDLYGENKDNNDSIDCVDYVIQPPSVNPLVMVFQPCSDYIEGGYGDDFLYGGPGNDVLQGDFFNPDQDDLIDPIPISFGNDKLHGNHGYDFLIDRGSQSLDEDADGVPDSEAGNQLYGQEDDDHLVGGENFDYLYGGTGNDWLWGGGGRMT